MANRHTPAAPASPSDDIIRLLEAEKALEALLTGAREEAQSLLESAYAEAGAGMAALDRELVESRKQLETELAAERERRSGEQLDEGRRRAAALDATPATVIEELSAVVLARLLSEAES